MTASHHPPPDDAPRQGPRRAAGKVSVYLVSTANGCQTNLLDNALMRERLGRAGYRNVSRPEDADILIVNSCGFTTDWEKRSLSTIEELSRSYPDKEVMVGGCLPKINGPKLAETFEGFTFGPGQVTRLLAHMDPEHEGSTTAHTEDIEGTDHQSDSDSGFNSDSDPVNFAHEVDLASSRPENRTLLRLAPLLFGLERAIGRVFQPLDHIARSAAFSHRCFTILASTGCRGTCTYCAIKKAKGPVRSKDPRAIMGELRRGLDAGHLDFWLAGDDVGCWGHDLGLDAADLLHEMLGVPEDFRLVIGSFHPAWFIRLAQKMRPVLEDRRVININLPLQSGSPVVLRRMGRGHHPGPVVDALRQIKRGRPDLVLKTHLMVGFPGETEADFPMTQALVAEFDLVIPFCFTPRPGTSAASLQPAVPRWEKAARLRRLKLEIARRYAAVVLQSCAHAARKRAEP